MDGIWSMIGTAVIFLVCTAILSFCIPLLKAKLGEDRFAALQTWIAVSVQAAEQLFGSGEGRKKKDYVLSLLLDRGLVRSADEVTALLESEVYRMQNK